MNQQLAQFRNEIDQFLRIHPQSPLSSEQKDDFEGLDYYDENEALIIQPHLEGYSVDEPHIEMETSIGDVSHYRKWGKATFEVNGVETSLIIYSDPWGESLFIPFKDATNGKETYGAGRYLDSERPGITITSNKKLQLNFNFAYNPYCAYSDAFSCPLPPRENWMQVPITAGEKDFTLDTISK
ncbi:MAG: DUF1684 domain-containing protein [Chloroflexota bacterium]